MMFVPYAKARDLFFDYGLSWFVIFAIGWQLRSLGNSNVRCPPVGTCKPGIKMYRMEHARAAKKFSMAEDTG